MNIEVLRGICLEVAEGDLLSIMGPSGSGKSTLMNIIGLLGRPTAGSYFLNGRDIRSMKDRELSSYRNANIGFVFQSFQLLGHLTALENVAVPLVYRGMGPRRDPAPGAGDPAEGRHGGPHRHKPDQLSAGRSSGSPLPGRSSASGRAARRRADRGSGFRNREEVMDLLIRLNVEGPNHDRDHHARSLGCPAVQAADPDRRRRAA